MAKHSVERQAKIAENIANANTPGYKAQDLEPFSEAYKRSQMSGEITGKKNDFRAESITTQGVGSPNGNTVSLEDQMWRSSSASRDHQTAITIYTKSLAMLRASLSGGNQ